MTEGKRAFRSEESLQAQAFTRAQVRPFLESRGFTILEDARPRGGQEHVVTAQSPTSGVLKMRVRCCWTWYKAPKGARTVSAVQLTAGNKGGWDATFARLLETQEKTGVTHLLVVQGAEEGIVSAVLLPVADVQPLWERQRDVFNSQWKAGRIKSRANSVENGDSPTLWLKDERTEGRKPVTDALWTWPTLVDLSKLPVMSPSSATPEQVAEELAKLARKGSQDGEAGVSNPDWTRDELILALELYFREPAARGSKTHPACKELSELLNRLPIHTGKPRSSTFRNTNGVGMKLSNFLRYDPSYKGRGLPSGSVAEEEVWNTFAHDYEKLKAAADAIRAGAGELIEQGLVAVDDDDGAAEGRILTRLHKLRERNPGLAKKKKAQVQKQTGALKCEVCSFDFKVTYGELGDGFAECHHGKPLSEVEPGSKTMLADLHIVCANCHRMLHRGKAWPTVARLRKQLKEMDPTRPCGVASDR